MPAWRPIPALGFDRLTPLFDGVAGILGFGRSFKQNILTVARIRDGEVLLDIGCGTGTLLVLAKQQHARAQAIGIDIDLPVIQLARRKFFRAGVQAELLEAGAQRLPLADASIDVAVSSLIFHHLPTVYMFRLRSTPFAFWRIPNARPSGLSVGIIYRRTPSGTAEG